MNSASLVLVVYPLNPSSEAKYEFQSAAAFCQASREESIIPLTDAIAPLNTWPFVSPTAPIIVATGRIAVPKPVPNKALTGVLGPDNIEFTPIVIASLTIAPLWNWSLFLYPFNLRLKNVCISFADCLLPLLVAVKCKNVSNISLSTSPCSNCLNSATSLAADSEALAIISSLLSDPVPKFLNLVENAKLVSFLNLAILLYLAIIPSKKEPGLVALISPDTLKAALARSLASYRNWPNIRSIVCTWLELNTGKTSPSNTSFSLGSPIFFNKSSSGISLSSLLLPDSLKKPCTSFQALAISFLTDLPPLLIRSM